MRSKDKKPIRNIGIWKGIALIGIILFSAPGFSQQDANLEKYWRYRDRLRQEFMVESSDVLELGVNVPLSALKYFGTGGSKTDGTYEYLTTAASAGDGNNVRGNYLGVLATELWLLKNNEQDYSQTLKELYYFMLAMERMDAYSESYTRAAEEFDMYWGWDRSNWDPTTTQYVEGDINGYQIRNDADSVFWENSKNDPTLVEFAPGIEFLKSTMINTPINQIPLKGNSQDNIANNLVGISLLKSLVGVENVSGIPVTFDYQHIPNYLSDQEILNGDYVDFGLWAEDLTRRYIDYIQNETLRQLGISTDVRDILEIAIYTAWSKWYLWNPIKNMYVYEGSGSDGGIHYCTSYGFLETGTEIVGESLLDDNNSLSLIANQTFKASFKTLIWPKNANKIIRVLGALGDVDVVFGTVLDDLKSHRENQMEECGDSVERSSPFEHLPLIYIILNRNKYDRDDFYIVGDSDYDSEIDLYDSYLDLAEDCGTCTYLSPFWSTYRTGAECSTRYAGEDTKTSGIDYMLLHNLRYMAFHWPDFDDVIAEPNYGYETVTLTGGDIYSASNIENTDVEFLASRSIVLQPGFKVENAHFYANVESITDGYEATKYVDLNLVKCDLDPFPTQKSASKNVDTTTTIFESESNDLPISIYPNPVQDIVNVYIPKTENISSARVLIYNSYGQLEYDKPMESTNMAINTDNLKSGLYIIMVYHDNQTYSEKILKE